jgi:hypothetical protein
VEARRDAPRSTTRRNSRRRMTVETFLTKRRAFYAGEIGLFATSQMADEDLAIFALNKELMAKLWSEKRIEQLRYLWGLVHKVADNTNLFLDKDDAMEGFKVRVGYSKAVYDPRTEKVKLKGRSLQKITDEQLKIVTGKVQAVIREEIFPGMKDNELRREIEDMLSERAT